MPTLTHKFRKCSTSRVLPGLAFLVLNLCSRSRSRRHNTENCYLSYFKHTHEWQWQQNAEESLT
eukprot:2322049-Amphidinium_carterae.1